MGWCGESGWVLLVFLSVLSVLLSVILCAAGGILKFTPDFLLSLVLKSPDGEIPALPVPGNGVPVLSEVGVAVMVLGGVICLLSFTACCGACCKYRGLLVVFSLFNILTIIGVSVATVMFVDKNSTLHTSLRNLLSEETKSLYKKDTDELFIQILSVISLKMKCCGVIGPGDLDPDWQQDPNNVMTSCCKSFSDSICPRNADDIYHVGCYETILDNLLGEYKTWIVLSISIVLLILALQAVVAVAIVLDRARRKVAPK